MCSKLLYIKITLVLFFAVSLIGCVTCYPIDKAEIEHFKAKGRDKRFFGKWQLVTKDMQEGENCYILKPEGTRQYLVKGEKPNGYEEYYYTEKNILYILDTGGGKNRSSIIRATYSFSDDGQFCYTKDLDYDYSSTWVRLKDK